MAEHPQSTKGAWSKMPTNFNDVSPAAPAGKANVAWQKDGSGNVSAAVPVATSSVLGIAKPDNATVTITAGVLSATGSGGTVTAVTASSPLASSGGATPNITITSPLPVANGGTGTTTPAIVAGTNITVSGSWPNQTINSAASVQNTRTINTTAPLTGGGDLSTDRTLAVSTATSSTLGVVKPDNSTVTISGGILSATGSGGSVTSVALTVPAWLTVAGSPITTSGTFAVTGTSEAQNLVLASPNGSSGAVSPRALVTADLPAGVTQTIASGTAVLGTSAIASGAAATVVTVSATGVATTDTITADFNADPTSTTGYSPSVAGMLTIIKYPTTNNVNFKVVNNTGSSITPGAVTLNWRVIR